MLFWWIMEKPVSFISGGPPLLQQSWAIESREISRKTDVSRSISLEKIEFSFSFYSRFSRFWRKNSLSLLDLCMRIWNINLVLFSIEIENSRQPLYVCGINDMCLIMNCLKVRWMLLLNSKYHFEICGSVFLLNVCWVWWSDSDHQGLFVQILLKSYIFRYHDVGMPKLWNSIRALCGANHNHLVVLREGLI